MLRTFAIALAVAATCAASAFGQFDPQYNVEAPVKRLALVVGNSDYLNAEALPGSVKDARLIAERLAAEGFAVTLAENVATRSDFLTKYFLNFVDQIEEGSFAVLYFSGHGFTYGGESYLAPLKFPKKVSSTDVFTTFISASALQERMNLRNPALLIMLLDACRNVSGFIDSSSGGPKDVEKGLASLSSVQNNIIGYASEPGKISIGSAVGELSKYTAALLKHLPAPDIEFDRAHREVIADVRSNTSNTQSPWLSSSSTLDVYFNPSPFVIGQFKTAWQAAQQANTTDAVKRYLDLFGLGPYAASARKWLAERTQQAGTFTQLSAPQIDSLWFDAGNGPAFSTRITGPFGLSRVASGDQPTIKGGNVGNRPKIQRDPLKVANVLAASQNTVVLEPLAARLKPDSNATMVASLKVGSNLAVDSVEEDAEGRVWLKAALDQTPGKFYVQVPPTAGTLDVFIGQALREFDLDPPIHGSVGVANEMTVDKALREIRAAGQRANWISISVPKTDPRGKAFSEREALFLGARASHGAFLLSKAVPRGRITIVNGADFSSDNPRVRIFGK